MIKFIKKLKFFYKVVFLSLFFGLIFSSFFLIVFSFFPIQSKIDSNSVVKFPKFFQPWPSKLTEEQAIEAKKMKKYAKAEQKRRQEKQLQQMNLLNAPIYNLFLDENVFFSSNKEFLKYGKMDLTWPVIPSQKVFKQTTEGTEKKSAYVLFPSAGWSHVQNGVFLSAGDEIKFDVPLSKEKRYLNINVFPLSEGDMHVSLGLHSWSRVFHDEDIQQKNAISIPIYDQSATTIKITSSALNFYLTDVNVSHILSSARQPIHVSDKSHFWSFQPYFPNEHDVPVEEKNLQIKTSEPVSTALGYNVILIHLNAIDSNLLSDDKTLSAVAPHLFEMKKKGVFFEQIDMPSNSFVDNFRSFAFLENPQHPIASHLFLLKNAISHEKNRNMYLRFQKYGYRTLVMSPPQALLFPKKMLDWNHSLDLYNRWLDAFDWPFEKENQQTDEDQENATGLQAIFKLPNKRVFHPVQPQDEKNISSLLAETSPQMQNIPDWNADEYFFMNPAKSYVPMLVESFKQWTLSNSHERFFAHVFLNDPDFSDRPFFKDFKKSFFSALTHPKDMHALAYASYVDRALEQIEDTVKGRKIEHRTIFFLVLQQDQKTSKAKGIFVIPGLVPKKAEQSQSVLQSDILATLFSSVGIPSGQNTSYLDGYDWGRMLEMPSMDPLPVAQSPENSLSAQLHKKTTYYQYHMLIHPGQTGCAPFSWKASNEAFLNLEASVPVYQKNKDTEFQIFPCSFKEKFIQVSWYQKKNALVEDQSFLQKKLGGVFSVAKDTDDLATFYFGDKQIPSNHVLFSFDHISDADANKLFFVETTKSNQAMQKAAQLFSSRTTQKTEIAFFINEI